MGALQKALSDLREHYKANGGPSYAVLAGATGLSESTVQRYLSPNVTLKCPNYENILSLATALGMGTEDLTLDRELVDEIENKEQLRDMIMELREMNIEELARNDAQWRDRLNAEMTTHNESLRTIAAAHDEQFAHLQQVYAEQLGQLTSVSNEQTAQMLATHQEQERRIQETARQQYEALQAFADKQKDADERAKAYLKRQVRTWKIVSFLFALSLILLLIVDLKNPDRGWIKFIGGLKLFSMRGVV